MKKSFYDKRKEMALLGYYNESDYAKIKKVTRAAIQIAIKEGRIKAHEQDGRKWVKHDNGALGEQLFNVTDYIRNFTRFGFERKSKSWTVNNAVPCEIKRVNDTTINIRFLNSLGDMMCICADMRTMEIIEHETLESLAKTNSSF